MTRQQCLRVNQALLIILINYINIIKLLYKKKLYHFHFIVLAFFADSMLICLPIKRMSLILMLHSFIFCLFCTYSALNCIHPCRNNIFRCNQQIYNIQALVSIFLKKFDKSLSCRLCTFNLNHLG